MSSRGIFRRVRYVLIDMEGKSLEYGTKRQIRGVLLTIQAPEIDALAVVKYVSGKRVGMPITGGAF